jgi:hypothetical protein
VLVKGTSIPANTLSRAGDEMFEWLAKFDRIFVTGPQRSGTRICAQMIAYDTDHEYIDERDFCMDSLYMLCSLLENKHRLVIQCPVLCRYVHALDASDAAIVLMRRDVQDIIVSQTRIRWGWEWLELARYDCSDGTIAEVKYRFWEEYQKKRIKHAFEIDYESLKEHPLWVSNHLRLEFSPAQTVHQNGTPTINQDARPCPRPGVLCLEGSAVSETILVKTRESAQALNETGRLIWSLCDGVHTRQDILEALKTHFDVDESVAARDVDEFISDLLKKGFLWLSLRADTAARQK